MENISEKLEKILNEIKKLQVKDKKVLTIDEAADYIGVKVRTLRKLVSKKDINCYKPNGKDLYFKLSDIENYLSRRKLE